MARGSKARYLNPHHPWDSPLRDPISEDKSCNVVRSGSVDLWCAATPTGQRWPPSDLSLTGITTLAPTASVKEQWTVKHFDVLMNNIHTATSPIKDTYKFERSSSICTVETASNTWWLAVWRRGILTLKNSLKIVSVVWNDAAWRHNAIQWQK